MNKLPAPECAPKSPVGPFATALAALVGASSASAQTILHFVPSGTNTITFNGGTPNHGLFIDLNGGVAGVGGIAIDGADFAFTFQSGEATKPIINTIGGSSGYIVGNGAYAVKILANGAINDSVYVPGHGTAYIDGSDGDEGGQWIGGGSGYLGFSFVPDATTLYGWMHMTYDSGTHTVTIDDWAYDTTGVGIAAGITAIPEPAETAAIMAAFLAGSAAMMRRRRQRAAVAA